MSKLYDRAEIYDLIENEKRTEIIRRDWKQFLGERKIHSLLDVSIGTGGMTLPLQELGIDRPENIVVKNLYALFGFEEVPKASDLEEDEINAVLRL